MPNESMTMRSSLPKRVRRADAGVRAGIGGSRCATSSGAKPRVDRLAAGGLHSRTIEILDQRGIADRFLSQGRALQVAAFSRIPFDIGISPRGTLTASRCGKTASATTSRLGRRIGRADLSRNRADGCGQDASGVTIVFNDGNSLRSQYLVGCDGGRSSVRKATGIEFPGWDATFSCLVAEVDTAPTLGGEPEWDVVRRDAIGVHGFTKLEGGKTAQVVVTERQLGPSGEPGLHELSKGLTAEYGTDYGMYSPAGFQVYDMARQPAAYRDRRSCWPATPPRTSPCRWARPQHRCAGCGESRLETGPSGPACLPRQSSRQLPHGAAPGRGWSAAQHDGADGALASAETTKPRRSTKCSRNLLGMAEPRKRSPP